MENLSQPIRDRMHELGMSQSDVARFSGLSPSTIRRSVNGLNIRLSSLIRISVVLDLMLMVRLENSAHECEFNPNAAGA